VTTAAKPQQTPQSRHEPRARGEGPFPALPFAVNSHIHLPPNFSAFDSVGEPVAMAALEGLGLIGLSNYYDYRVYADVARHACDHGIFVLQGTEIIALDEQLRHDGTRLNDPGNPGKVYVCGKAMRRVDGLPQEGRRLLDRIRDADARRMDEMTQKMGAVLREMGFESGLTASVIREQIAHAANVPLEAVVLQERHLAKAFQRDIFGRLDTDEERTAAAQKLLCADAPVDSGDEVALQNAMRSAFMKAGRAAFVQEEFVSVEEARALVLSAGGIPCYPVLADGTKPITEFEADPVTLAIRLKDLGFHAVEFIPNRNTPQVLNEYVAALRSRGMIVLAGTEHNTTEKIAMTPVCAGGVPIPPGVQRIFDEGTCVAVAHQALDMPYITQRGELPVSVDELEQHINRLATAGAEYLMEYHDKKARGEKP